VISRVVFEKGFTLIELTLVMVIIGLLSVGGINLAKVKREQALYSSSEEKLKQIKQALITHVLVYGHLPCPDTGSDGKENRPSGADDCSSVSGKIPYLDLGLSQAGVRDNWGNYVVYFINTKATSSSRVSDQDESASFFDLASSPGSGHLTFDLDTPPKAGDSGVGNLNIKDGFGSNWALYQLAVLVAYNSNGAETKADCSAMGLKEKENCDGDRDFIRKQLLLKKGSDFFDDSLVTVSAMDIKTSILKHNPSSID